MSASLRTGIRKLLYEVRAIPGKLGFRVYTVSTQTSVWSGAEIGQGTETVTTTSIVEADGQAPRVRWLDNEEMALGGYDKPTVQVGPITPNFSGGGTTLATLKPISLSANSEFYYVLTGPDFLGGARFRLVSDTTDRMGRYTVKLQRAGDG